MNKSLIKKRKKSLHRDEKIWALVFVLLPILGFLIFTVGATIYSIYFSFTDYNPIRGTFKFVEWKNYTKLFDDKYFINAISNTLFLMLEVPIRILIAFFLAVAINENIKGGKIFRVIYYLPYVSSVVAINIIWRYIFNGEYGILNHLLGLDIQWLGTDETLIKFAVIIKNVWGGLGGSMILYLAGIQAISPTYYEAADIDGASHVQKMFKITFPLLTPVTFFIVVTSIIGSLQSYADSQILAGGAKGAQTIVFYIWQKGIDQNRYGLASAASITLAIGIFVVTLFQFIGSKRWVHEE